ncbi:MAG: UDP-N-acetylmuramoyl-tripeptide--D-alanyl-D-alanine ligase [bacterium]
MKMTLQEIAEATGGEILQGNPSFELSSFSTDSRTLKNGALFVCLRGDRFDAHEFLPEVVDKGAAAVILEKARFDPGRWKGTKAAFIGVTDTLRALGDAARAWRRKFSIPLVAVAGSNGKTTTKDMTVAVLSAQFKTLGTEGNLNNLIGVPLMLFKLTEEHEAAVIEMGMNNFGENARLTEIAEPTVGLITNVGMEHLEKLKNLEGVARAEGELFEKMPPGSLALVNQDDPYVSKMATRAFRITYGMEKPADVFCGSHTETKKGIELEIQFRGKSYSFQCPTFGEPNRRNALAAVAVGFGLGLEAKKIQKGLKEFKGRPLRMERLDLKEGIVVLNDCYNANPSSMHAALTALKGLKGENPGLAVLGEMLELGDFAREGHRLVGEAAANNRIGYLIAVGPFAAEVAEAAKQAGLNSDHVRAFASQEEIGEILGDWVRKAGTVLVKGSRGAKMEKVTEMIRSLFER